MARPGTGTWGRVTAVASALAVVTMAAGTVTATPGAGGAPLAHQPMERRGAA